MEKFLLIMQASTSFLLVTHGFVLGCLLLMMCWHNFERAAAVVGINLLSKIISLVCMVIACHGSFVPASYLLRLLLNLHYNQFFFSSLSYSIIIIIWKVTLARLYLREN